jgi:hypothetical protein
MNGENWDFVKHGVGLRFTRSNPTPHLVIDIYKCFDDPRIVDEYRLAQYLQSTGENLSELEAVAPQI